jgi:hypothetical protein
MKRIIPLLLVLLLGCREKFPHPPSGVISSDEMKMILSDMLIADALSETRALGGTTNEKTYTEQYYATIYKNHHTTREQFLKSYQFYEDNPVWYNKIMDDVLAEMSKREAAVSK